jgi:hypothetical protein
MRSVINLYLTWNCNFYCGHCIHECGPTQRESNMSWTQLNYASDFAEWLFEHKSPLHVLGLTGGEPTLHPYFWSHVMPIATKIRQIHSLENVELHTNASIPVPEQYKTMYSKFFSKIYVGHDPMHRSFKKLDELYLQDYTEISKELVLRQNRYIFPNNTETMIVRNRGRAAELVKSGKYEVVPVTGYPKPDCIRGKGSFDSLNFQFTPDHINHCGEKSHPLPNPEKPEGQFHPYGMDFDILAYAALDYELKYCGDNCSQPCNAHFIRKTLYNTPYMVSI